MAEIAGAVFDVAIIGTGVVGCAIARELSRYQLKIALIDGNPDVGMGTSKANTAIWHTGYDASPGSLESRLLKRSYPLMEKFLVEAGIAHERLGGILIAWSQEQQKALPSLLEKAHRNGDMDVTMISPEEIYRREPDLARGALGGLFVPGEGILCTYSVTLACAYQAVLNDTGLFLDFPVERIEKENDNWSLRGWGRQVTARYVVNAAGLFSDEINARFGHTDFKVTPRRGQLIIYDKLARSFINHVLLPVPTSVTKGVLIAPTVYGNILLGPTAEELQDKTATGTTADGLEYLMEKGISILPKLAHEEVTATYSGLRAATEYSDYQIKMHADQHYLCVAGIRSTGLSGSLGIAEYSVELLKEAGLPLEQKNEFKSIKMPAIGQADVRPHQNSEMIAHDAAYAEIICHCERVSRGELRDAMQAPIPARTLDGLRRRTRASQGRCQGFNCHAALCKILDSENPTTPKRVLPRIESIHNDKPKVASQETVDVLIVGAGPAGLSAAVQLKKNGIRKVLVLDREPEAGGMPRLCHHTGFGREDLWRMYSGPQYARYYRQRAEQTGVEIRTSTTMTGWGNDRPGITSTSPNGLGEIEAKTILLATGVRERPRHARLVPGTRPQGIYTTGSLQRFVHQEHLPVGKRAVIIGAELVSLSALLTLMYAGVRCEWMLTGQPRHQIYLPYLPMKWVFADLLAGTRIVKNAEISEIFGSKRVEGVEFLDENGQKQHIECDTVIFTGDWIPEHELARMGGLILDRGTLGPQVDRRFRSSRQGIFAAGNLLRGVATADRCALEGIEAARSIVQYLSDGQWRAQSVQLEIDDPIVWVFPNVISAVDAGQVFRFRSSKFMKSAKLKITQGDVVLHSQLIQNVIVNEIMAFTGGWTRSVDLSAGPVKLELV